MPRCEKVLAGRGIAFGRRAEEADLREAQEQGAGDVNETTIDEEPSNIDVEYLPVISENRFEEAQLGICRGKSPAISTIFPELSPTEKSEETLSSVKYNLALSNEKNSSTGSEERREVEISNRGRFSPTDAKLSLFEAIFRDDR
ncbi:unnamed protein product [Caenorhabditis auriculariae]|uniref:Uncharacterized protein n=1 Tax=Caenorhabditis auriculariae TaxID=2777116 RepID=A0A8S1HPX6_9PELO|nr:unnamed protein product [Caenorhabditis auriculariae]